MNTRKSVTASGTIVTTIPAPPTDNPTLLRLDLRVAISNYLDAILEGRMAALPYLADAIDDARMALGLQPLDCDPRKFPADVYAVSK